MPQGLRTGFNEVIRFGESHPGEFSTAEIMEYLQSRGMTSGAATGTIRRAREAGLIDKRERAKYVFCSNSRENSVSDSPLMIVKQILADAAASIDNKVKLSNISSSI